MGSTVYLLSGSSRYLYKNDIYRTLALPDGYVLGFRYRKKWVSEEILRDPDSLKGEKGLVVARRKTGFGLSDLFPLREVKIIDIEREESIKWKETVLYLYLKMKGLWPEYPADEEIDDRPFEGIYDVQEGSETKNDDGKPVLFAGEDAVPTVEDTDPWTKIVNHLADQDVFDDAIFYRIDKMCDIEDVGDPEGEKADVCRINDYTRGYQLFNEKNYVLEMVFNFGRDPPDGVEESLLKISPTSQLDVFPTDIRLGFRVDKKRISVNIKQPMQNAIEFLAMDVNGQIEGAQLELPLKVRGEHPE